VHSCVQITRDMENYPGFSGKKAMRCGFFLVAFWVRVAGGEG
jgi:hypothetical protein